MKNLFGIPLKRKGSRVLRPDPETERRADDKRVRKAAVIRAQREAGAFDSVPEPRGARPARSWPGGTARRNREIERLAAQASPISADDEPT